MVNYKAVYKCIKFPILCFIIFILFLFFYRLGTNNLWHDESEVAQIAKNILRFGIPRVWNGTTFLPIAHDSYFHSIYPPYVFTLQTWLMFYTAALSIKLFGSSLFGVRFLFTIIGATSIFIFHKILKTLNSNKITVFALILLSLSIQYIIFIRQARYYSLVFFFSLLSIYFFIKYYTIKKGKETLILFFLSMFGLFHSHYLSFYSLTVGFLLFILVKEKFLDRKRVLLKQLILNPLLLTIILLIAINSMWTMFARGNIPPVEFNPQMLSKTPLNFFELLKKINRQIPLITVIGGIYFIFYKKSAEEIVKRQIFFLFITLIFCVLFVTAVTTSFEIYPSISADLRYTLSVFPLFFIFTAYLITVLYNKSKLVGILVLITILFTNLLSLPMEYVTKEGYWPITQSRYELRSYFTEYVFNELKNGYIGPVDSIVEYLKNHYVENDMAFISSEGTAVMYSIPDLRIDNDYTFQKKTDGIIKPVDLLSYRFVIFRDVCNVKCIFRNNEKEAIAVLDKYFNRVDLGITDYIVQNREEIPYHIFKTQTLEPTVIIYEKN